MRYDCLTASDGLLKLVSSRYGVRQGYPTGQQRMHRQQRLRAFHGQAVLGSLRGLLEQRVQSAGKVELIRNRLLGLALEPRLLGGTGHVQRAELVEYQRMSLRLRLVQLDRNRAELYEPSDQRGASAAPGHGIEQLDRQRYFAIRRAVLYH